MSDVAVFVVSALFEHLVAEGESTEGLLDGTALSTENLGKFSGRRCSWDDFATIVERIADRLGGYDAMESFGKRISRKPPGVLAMLATRYGRPHTLYYLGSSWYGPSLFRGTRATTTNVEGGVIQSLTMPPESRVSVAVYRLFAGILAAAPRMMGWDARVVLTYQEREAAFRIHLTPPEGVRVDAGEIEREREAADADRAEFDALMPTEEAGEPDSLPAQRLAPPLTQRVRWLYEGQSDAALGLSARKVARQLGMSERSLSRGLAAEGTTFRDQRDELRRDRAIDRLRSGIGVEKITDELGFSDTSSFHRAFRRWTGMSPGRFLKDD